MNKTIDLNADLGEGFPFDKEIMSFISSANISCGVHAGDKETMLRTIELCLQHGVAVGAHPSFPDRENFGRKEMHLSPEQLKANLLEQLYAIQDLCLQAGTKLHHVKPHGALYNLSARDAQTALVIADAVLQVNSTLRLYGLSGSFSISEGVMAGLKTVAEAFADRTYVADGSLTPRSLPEALIEEPGRVVAQALMLARDQRVFTTNGECIEVMTESICLHGDTAKALLFSQMIHKSFNEHGIYIKAVS